MRSLDGVTEHSNVESGKLQPRADVVAEGQSRAEAEAEADDGHRHGNFKHYYEFHNASAERFKGILPGSFRRMWLSLDQPDTFTVLDVGSNEGDLTVELLRLVQAELPGVRCVAYGLDFDSALVEVAKSRHQHNPHVDFFVFDVMTENNMDKFLMARGLVGRVSLVACLRVSMWVHLNYGNEGLTRLLSLLGGATSCALALDPQKLSYYKKACSRNAKLGKPPFPYALEDLSVSDDLPTWCLRYFREEYQLTTLLHKDISKWGGTLLCMMRETVETITSNTDI